MKAVILNDTHFGYKADSPIVLEYFLSFFEEQLFPYLKENNIKTIFHLGDVFDRRKYVNFKTLNQVRTRFLEPLREMGVKCIAICGNHDTYYKNKNDVNSPDLLLKDYHNINVISSAENIYIDGVQICMVPWICPENYQESLDTIKNTKADLCMGHFEIAGFSMYRGMESHEGFSKDIFKKFDLVFSGHYHHRSDDSHIYYLGNPYELTWQDYNDPRGFHLFDLQTRGLEFVHNTFTMFSRLEYDDKEKDPIDLDAHDLKDCYVKLVVTNKTDYYKFDKFIQKLYTKGCHEIKIIEDMSEFGDGELSEEINLEDTVSVLSNYIDSLNTDVDKEQIKNFLKSLHTEAINTEVV